MDSIDPRMKKLLEISYMYYIDGLSQSEIAKNVSMSRSMVSIMLSEARSRGIVQVQIKNSDMYSFHLERKLEKIFRLKRAIVIPTLSEDIKNQNLEVQLADAATNYLWQMLEETTRIGLSWGEVSYHMANRFKQDAKPNLLIAPLTGGIGNNMNAFHPSFCCTMLADKLECTSLGLYAPNFLSTKEIRDVLYLDESLQQVIRQCENVDIAIVGIHNIDNSRLSKIEFISEENLEEFKEKGAVGEFNTWFFDKSGHFIQSEIMEKNIAVSSEKLSQIPLVIGVGGGEDHAEAVHSALKGMLVNVIVTDESCAREIASQYQI